MSLLVETVAKELLIKNNRTGFTSGDLDIMHQIYDECVKRGMKKLNNEHPLNILKRVRTAMLTRYLFDIYIVKDYICKKLSCYELKNF